MKILTVVSALDLRYRLGCTPAWWQLLKALHENENEVVVIPYLGQAFESLWWRSYPNPWKAPGALFYTYSRKIAPKRPGKAYGLRELFARVGSQTITRPIWLKTIRRILHAEKDFDVVLFLNVPLNQIRGLPTSIKSEFGTKIAFYDGDMPTILPEHETSRGFMFDYYRRADLTEFDVFLVNSEGVIETLVDQGARNVKPLHYAADPDLFHPITCPKKWDVAFFGYGSQYREKWMNKMITAPSRDTKLRFVVGGADFGISLGESAFVGDIPMSGFGRFCCSSRMNLNITRESHTSVYASSTARPFELAAMGCAIVSCPYNGLEKWFEPGREIILVGENDSIPEIYSALLEDEESLQRMGSAARARVLKDHTYKNRATQLCSEIMKARTEL